MDLFDVLLAVYPEFGSPDVPQASESAFVPYLRPETRHLNLNLNRNLNPKGKNMNKRVIELLRRIQAAGVMGQELEHDFGYRHMINERQRRGKLRRNFEILQSLLPPKTKNDKMSVVQMAAQELVGLKRRKEELQGQNEELTRLMVGGNGGGDQKRSDTATIRVKVGNAGNRSPIDSAVGVAACLKSRGLRVVRLKMEFSPPELSAVVDVEAQDGREAEEAISESLAIGGR
ncbi:transcription factor bHLH92 isoform X2 [Nymphaea colorata]|nr:transcription factor bHLH92 isoform X2 [Nymphaea colorata]